MINIDKQYPEYVTIDTDTFLANTLGDPLDLSDEAWEHIVPGEYLMKHCRFIKAAIEEQEDRDYRMTEVFNVYNGENDFSDVFQYVVYYPADADDWVYADEVYVAIEPHLGGDVRGNYGNTRLYGPVNSLVDSNFLDWCVGWSLFDIDSDERLEVDNFDIGYTSNPTYHMTQEISDLEWNEEKQGFVGMYEGNKVVCRPYHWAA